jgi:phosphate transport system substrate-binding protein
LALLITAGIVSSGFWWFTRKSGIDVTNLPIATDKNTSQQPPNNQTDNPSDTNNNREPVSSSSSAVNTFTPPTNVPQNTTININGSTSMVQINQAFKNRFEQQFPGTKVNTNAQGTNKGIELLKTRKIDIAAISRPLTSQEETEGLTAVPISKDAIAIVVGINNPFRRGLTQQQVVDIFQGKITNWSEVGGENQTIRLINRPSSSGTRQVFQELVLKGANFGNTNNFITLERDATTPILRALATDGISYATYGQVANQRTIRTVPVNGLTPEATSYPYERNLYYAYQQPASPQVQAFLGYVFSPLGQQILNNQ